MSQKRVAIIGAGVSGLTSAKYALENGLNPVVFEKSAQISGLWNAKETAIWEGLRSNTTKLLMRLSDHEWPQDTPLFPRANQIDNYLVDYARKFGLESHIRLRHKVEFVRCLEEANKSWQVRFRNLETDELKEEIFDFLIIASGSFQSPYTPKDQNVDNFKGLVLHSSQFRLNDPRFKSKNVVVIGGSISASDIAAHLVGHATSVTHIFRRAPLILPLIWKLKLGDANDNKYSIMPLECFVFTRAAVYPTQETTKEEFVKNGRMAMKKFASFQADKNPMCPQSLHVDFDNLDEELIITLNDSYLDELKNKKITPIKSSIKSYSDTGIYLENGDFIQADVVIYSTGYKFASADYLDKPVLDAMRYREGNQRFPVMIYKETFVPGYETMAYVGLIHIAEFPGYEMQARWANSVFSGKTSFPDAQRMEKYISDLEAKCNNDKGEQFPYGSYPLLVDNYAEEIGLKPDLVTIKEKNPEIYDILWNDAIYWSHFLYDKQDKDYFFKMLNDVHELKSKVYELNPNEHDVKQSEVIEQFLKVNIL